MDRKDFFRQITHTIGDSIASKLTSIQQTIGAEPELNENERVFLQEYTAWLAEFQGYVKRRNENPDDVENHKQLMKLTAEADKRKPQLEVYMQHTVFSKYFTSITNDLTQSISL